MKKLVERGMIVTGKNAAKACGALTK